MSVVFQVLANAETDGVVLHPRHLFEVMFDLVYHGHPEHMSTVGAALSFCHKARCYTKIISRFRKYL